MVGFDISFQGKYFCVGLSLSPRTSLLHSSPAPSSMLLLSLSFTPTPFVFLYPSPPSSSFPSPHSFILSLSVSAQLNPSSPVSSTFSLFSVLSSLLHPLPFLPYTPYISSPLPFHLYPLLLSHYPCFSSVVPSPFSLHIVPLPLLRFSSSPLIPRSSSLTFITRVITNKYLSSFFVIRFVTLSSCPSSCQINFKIRFMEAIIFWFLRPSTLG